MTNVGNPASFQDATNKRYVDCNFLKRDGSNNVVGDISLNNNNITDITDPVHDQDAANKQYVDSRKPVIIIWGQHKGNLTSDQYQWSFGGGDISSAIGFPMSVSGRILRASLSSINGADPSGRISINIVINGLDKPRNCYLNRIDHLPVQMSLTDL